MISQKSNKIADGCRFCWMCRHICPTGIATGREEFTPRARGLAVSMIARGMEYDQDLAEAFFSCALCGSCSNDCVTGYEPPVFIREARTEAVVQDILPAAVAPVVERALEGGDIVEKCCCADDSELLAKIAAAPAKAEVAVVLGETACNHRPETAVSFLNVLDKAGVAYCVIDKKVGGELFDLIGYVDEVKAQADAFAAAVAETGAKTVVALDATDARTLIQQYGEWEVKMDAVAMTATAFVAGLVKDGKLSLNKVEMDAVTYQDPDHIVRDLDESENGRQLLAAMGIEIKEMFLNHRLAGSCGNEVLASYFPHITSEMANIRIDDAKRTGACAIVTASPVDYDMLAGKCDCMKALDLFALIDSAC